MITTDCKLSLFFVFLTSSRLVAKKSTSTADNLSNAVIKQNICTAVLWLLEIREMWILNSKCLLIKSTFLFHARDLVICSVVFHLVSSVSSTVLTSLYRFILLPSVFLLFTLVLFSSDNTLPVIYCFFFVHMLPKQAEAFRKHFLFLRNLFSNIVTSP